MHRPLEARHNRHGKLALDPAPLPDGLNCPQSQDPVSQVPHVGVFKVEHLKQLSELSEKPPQAIVPRVLALQVSVLQLEDGVWVEGLQPTLDVALVEGPLKASVLSRNRSTFSCDIAYSDSPSISRASA